MAAPFRVLAIDGGGIRGIIPATVLVDLERRLAPRRVANVFDLIVGTSTGGILALGLTVPDGDRPRHPAERLLDLYLNDAETIFPEGGPASLPQRVREGARYPVAGLEQLLDSYVADTRLTDALIDVVVTSYDLAYGEPVMLSSRPRSGFVSDVSMVAAARATCAAPTFFKPQVITDGDRERILVDGGVYVNNPAVLGYLLGVQAASEERPLVLVSLGTGTRPPRMRLSAAEAHMGDSFGAARTLLEAVASGSGHLIHGLLTRLADGEHFRYWRLQTTVGPCSFTMDDSRPENVACLSERAREFVSGSDEELSAIARALGIGAGTAYESDGRRDLRQPSDSS